MQMKYLWFVSVYVLAFCFISLGKFLWESYIAVLLLR